MQTVLLCPTNYFISEILKLLDPRQCNNLYPMLKILKNIASDSANESGKVPTMLTKVPCSVVSMENGSTINSTFAGLVSSALATQSEEWRKGENQILSVS